MAQVRTWIEPVVAAAQVASSFYDTALLFSVKNYYNRTTTFINNSDSDTLQKAISNFYIIYNLILGLTPLLSAYILANIGDLHRRKVTICVPLFGYLISRCFLLPLIFLSCPIEIMFGSAALNGLTGWFTAYWAGVMAWASHGSSKRRRSQKLIFIELVYGLAGFAGSLSSGHIFIYVKITSHPGTTLIICSLLLYLFSLVYSIFILKVPQPEVEEYGQGTEENRAFPTEPTENSRLLDDGPSVVLTMATPSKVFIALLFTSGILYNIAVDGCVDVLSLFLLKEPLSFGPQYIGYANASGYMIFITSFLGVCILSRYITDVGLILLGILSFSAGVILMAFAQWPYLYFIARGVMMFALIPVPTIRSILSKHIQRSSYGKVFVVLQLSIAFTGIITSTVFNKLYQATLHSFSGTSFIISGIIAILSLVPVSVAVCKYAMPLCTRQD